MKCSIMKGQFGTIPYQSRENPVRFISTVSCRAHSIHMFPVNTISTFFTLMWDLCIVE